MIQIKCRFSFLIYQIVICIFYFVICKDSIGNDPKLVLGSNAKGPNNKFVERGYKRTRLTLKEKRLNITFLYGLT